MKIYNMKTKKNSTKRIKLPKEIKLTKKVYCPACQEDPCMCSDPF